jgi:hypothetical protein
MDLGFIASPFAANRFIPYSLLIKRSCVDLTFAEKATIVAIEATIVT